MWRVARSKRNTPKNIYTKPMSFGNKNVFFTFCYKLELKVSKAYNIYISILSMMWYLVLD